MEKKMKKITLLLMFLATFCLWGGEKLENETTKTIFSRASVRGYSETKLPAETLEFLVRAGMAAPSAVDKRPWEFIIVQDPAVLKELAEKNPGNGGKMALQAGQAIVVAGDLSKQHGGKDSTFWIMDCSAAVENILLAAQSLGLGAVWTAVYPGQDRIDPVVKALKLPENIVPLAIIPVGKPAGKAQPKDKFDKKKIHWNKF